MAKSRKEKRNRRTKRRGNKRMTRKRGAGLIDLFKSAKSAPKIVPDSPGPLGEIKIENMKPYSTDIEEKSYDTGNVVYLFEHEGNIFIIPRFFGERKTRYRNNLCLYEIFEKLTEKDKKNEIQKLSEKFNFFIGLFINTTESTCSFVNIKLSNSIAATSTSNNFEDSVLKLNFGSFNIQGYDLTSDISIKYKGYDYKSLLIKLLNECRDENQVQAFKNDDDDDDELDKKIDIIEKVKPPEKSIAKPSKEVKTIVEDDITVEEL